MPSHTNTLVWLDIPVIDLARAINFYQSVLACSLQDHRLNAPTATLMLNGTSNGLTLFKAKQERPVSSGSVPYLNCDARLEQALSQVRLLGGKVLQDIQAIEPFGYRAVILDSEGNRLALHSSSCSTTT
ncbi:VOC family protein [Reinekea sp.]|jgi:predicted enzyme related to lactoylglutathione lyase|uniref:VOC family protein n=1 Tax=Reinekea sp. TaxID=1970455 RepID=UPI003989D3BB